MLSKRGNYWFSLTLRPWRCVVKCEQYVGIFLFIFFSIIVQRYGRIRMRFLRFYLLGRTFIRRRVRFYVLNTNVCVFFGKGEIRKKIKIKKRTDTQLNLCWFFIYFLYIFIFILHFRWAVRLVTRFVRSSRATANCRLASSHCCPKKSTSYICTSCITRRCPG